MKKILLLFFVSALLPMAIKAQGTPTDDKITISDLFWDVDADGYYFIVSLEGSQIYSAYNLDIFLPTGFDVMYTQEGDDKNYWVMSTEDEDFYPFTKVGTKKTFKHTVNGNLLEGNQLRVSCLAQDNSEFKATSGTLFIVYVTVNTATLTASYSPKPIVRLSGQNLTTSAAVKYEPADYACRPFSTGIPTERTIAVNVSAANQVGTLILPFDTELPSGLKAYFCSSVSGDKLVLSEANSIEACTPYIVYASSGYSGNLSGTATLSDNSNVTDVFTDGLLTGVLAATTTNTGYVLQNQGEGPKFYDTNGGTFSIPAGRCYLTTPASPVKAFCFDFEGTTSIESIQDSKFKIQNKVFDLQGRKVSSPQRGIYIQGMRKVIVK